MDVLSLFAQANQDHTDHVENVMMGIAAIVISSFVAWVTAKWTIKGDERRAIREENIRMIEFAIEYPFLESDAFCNSWPNVDRSEDDKMRYENYCCHVFNVLQHAWEYTKGDLQQLQTVLYPKELIERHRRWWQNDDLNQEGYPLGFRRFVADTLREQDKNKGEHK